MIPTCDSGSRPLHRVARGVLLVGLLTSSWTVVAIRGIFVSDVLFFGGGAIVYATRAPLSTRHTRKTLALVLLSGWLLLLSAVVVAARFGTLAPLAPALRMTAVIVVVPIVVLAFVETIADARTALLMIFASAVVNAGVAVADMALGLGWGPAQSTWHEYAPTAESRAVGLTGHPNLLGYAATAALPLAPWLLQSARSRVGRWALLGGAITIAVGLLYSGSRGAAVGVTVGLVYVLAKTRRTSARAVLLVGAPVALLGVMLFSGLPLVSRFLGDQSAVVSDRRRLADLRAGLEVAVEGFPTGVGLHQLSEVHSGLLAVIVSVGVIGFLSLTLWCVVMVGGMKRAQRCGSGLSQAAAVACTGTAIGIACYLTTSPMILHRYAVLPVAMGLALCRITSGYEAGDNPHEETGSGPTLRQARRVRNPPFGVTR